MNRVEKKKKVTNCCVGRVHCDQLACVKIMYEWEEVVLGKRYYLHCTGEEVCTGEKILPYTVLDPDLTCVLNFVIESCHLAASHVFIQFQSKSLGGGDSLEP